MGRRKGDKPRCAATMCDRVAYRAVFNPDGTLSGTAHYCGEHAIELERAIKEGQAAAAERARYAAAFREAGVAPPAWAS